MGFLEDTPHKGDILSKLRIKRFKLYFEEKVSNSVKAHKGPSLMFSKNFEKLWWKLYNIKKGVIVPSAEKKIFL